MINRAPEIMLDAVDADEDLIDVPTPKGIRPLADPLSAYLRGEHRSETVPPETDSLVTDINAALVVVSPHRVVRLQCKWIAGLCPRGMRTKRL